MNLLKSEEDTNYVVYAVLLTTFFFEKNHTINNLAFDFIVFT